LTQRSRRKCVEQEGGRALSEESKGQQNRKNIRMAVEHSLSNYCPNTYNRMANLIAYDFNLCPDTVKYSYLSMFIEAGILEYNHDNQLDLSAKGKKIQTTSDGLTVEDLQKELDEENESRNRLGQKPVTLEEWKQMRSRRFKPLNP
jgi:hypothetical protein